MEIFAKIAIQGSEKSRLEIFFFKLESARWAIKKDSDSYNKVFHTRRDRTRGNVVPENGAAEVGDTGAIWGAKYRKMEHLDNYFRFD